MSPLLGSWVLMSAHGHSWALMSIWPWHHKHSLVQVTANGPKAACSWVLLSSLLVPITPWRQVHENSWLLMSAHEQSWALMSTNQHSWALISSQEQIVCLWWLMSTYDQPWTLMSLAPWSNGHSWELKSSHEHGVMEPWALISTFAAKAPYSWVLMGPHEHSWALIRPHDS